MTETKTKPTLETLGLTVAIESRGLSPMNAGEKEMIAWQFTFTNKRGIKESFDYFTGCGCVPWQDARKVSSSRFSYQEKKILDAGWQRHKYNHADVCNLALKLAVLLKWQPDPLEVLNCLARDGDALESTFEDWASNFGYDTDSRKAEKIYHACQQTALRLKRLVGAEQFQALAELEF